MAFVTKKGSYYQLVESRRVNGKPRQVVLCYLGSSPTVEAAYGYWRKQAYGRIKYSDDNVVTIAGERVHGDPHIHQLRAKQKVEVLAEYRDEAAKEQEKTEQSARSKESMVRSVTRPYDPRQCQFWCEAMVVLGFPAVSSGSKKRDAYVIPTLEQIKSQYRDMMKRLHPDSNCGQVDDDTPKQLELVKAAYAWLTVKNPVPWSHRSDWMPADERWARRGVWQTTTART